MKGWFASLPPIPVSTLLLYIFGSIIFLLLLAYLIYLAKGSWRRLDDLELKDRFAARNDFIKTLAQILGGAFFLLTIYFAYQNLAVSQKNLAAIQEKNVTDLYTKAIGQLASEKLEVRLGGIYALERIARDSKKDHRTIMEVLTAYVRNNAPATAVSEATPSAETAHGSPKEGSTKQVKVAKEAKPQIKADIQAVLTVIGRTSIAYAPKGEKPVMDLRGLNLQGIDLKGANLQGADLFRANLQGADLMVANLQEAHVSNTNLKGANLYQANLQGARLVLSNLEGAKLGGAQLQNAYLSRANLQKAILENANLQNAQLAEANLQEANLQWAQLEDANLQGADLSRANLHWAQLRKASLIKANLQGANLPAVDLYRANLPGANLQGANLSNCNLQEADLRRVDLSNCNLQEADLQNADLSNCNLQEADLRKTNLRWARGLTPEQVANAIWDEKTRWPEGFTPPPRKEEKK